MQKQDIATFFYYCQLQSNTFSLKIAKEQDSGLISEAGRYARKALKLKQKAKESLKRKKKEPSYDPGMTD